MADIQNTPNVSVNGFECGKEACGYRILLSFAHIQEL
jgi:hypothetical protein